MVMAAAAVLTGLWGIATRNVIRRHLLRTQQLPHGEMVLQMGEAKLALEPGDLGYKCS